ncbi:MAG: iron-containing redox enzyme family protein [Terriglobales bacterium]
MSSPVPQSVVNSLPKYTRIWVEESLSRIRQHPFIVSANHQELTKPQAERWIKCAGRESKSFPQILENMVARCQNDRVRSILSDNLDDEYGNGNPEDAHFKHYLHLLDELGIPRSDFDSYNERVGIRFALDLAHSISLQPSEALAVGYMLVNEGMTQITYSAAHKALSRYYPAIKTPFFSLHVEVDEKHVEDLYRAVEELPMAESDNLKFGVDIGERGMASLLDEALGIFDYVQ